VESANGGRILLCYNRAPFNYVLLAAVLLLSASSSRCAAVRAACGPESQEEK